MNVEWRCKTEQSAASSSKDQWKGGEGEEGDRRGEDSTHEEQEEGELGRRKVLKKLDPKEPTKEEREEHEKTHLPYRNWCRHCVRGQGKEEPCRRSTSDDPNVPEIHMDFMFMGNEGGARTLAMLVVAAQKP